jgi:uncharacterized protein (DUF1330 family)
MTAYILARVNVTDMARYQEYMKGTPGVIAQHGGRFVVRGGAKETVEGPEETARVVLIEFPSMEQARAFYRSPEYQKVKALREGAATGQFVILDGYRPA